MFTHVHTSIVEFSGIFNLIELALKRPRPLPMPQPPLPQALSYTCLICSLKCKSFGGLTRHRKSKHSIVPLPNETIQYKRIRHTHLTGTVLIIIHVSFISHLIDSARPCTHDGTFLEDPIPTPETTRPLDATPENDWAPFPDRLAYNWAQHYYVRLQSSEDEIYHGLDLWRATVIKHVSEHSACDDVPWKNAQDVHATIDSIKTGSVGWKTYKFRYHGPKPPTPLQWMEETYELNTRDVLALLEQQLQTPEFDGKFEYSPYEEYNSMGHHVYSNLMSAAWANREAV